MRFQVDTCYIENHFRSRYSPIHMESGKPSLSLEKPSLSNFGAFCAPYMYKYIHTDTTSTDIAFETRQLATIAPRVPFYLLLWRGFHESNQRKSRLEWTLGLEIASRSWNVVWNNIISNLGAVESFSVGALWGPLSGVPCCNSPAHFLWGKIFRPF